MTFMAVKLPPNHNLSKVKSLINSLTYLTLPQDWDTPQWILPVMTMSLTLCVSLILLPYLSLLKIKEILPSLHRLPKTAPDAISYVGIDPDSQTDQEDAILFYTSSGECDLVWAVQDLLDHLSALLLEVCYL